MTIKELIKQLRSFPDKDQGVVVWYSVEDDWPDDFEIEEKELRRFVKKHGINNFADAADDIIGTALSEYLHMVKDQLKNY